MAKSNNFQKSAKRTNRDLMRQIHLVISSHNAEAADPEAWDAFEPEEPIQRTNYDLTD